MSKQRNTVCRRKISASGMFAAAMIKMVPFSLSRPLGSTVRRLERYNGLPSQILGQALPGKVPVNLTALMEELVMALPSLSATTGPGCLIRGDLSGNQFPCPVCHLCLIVVFLSGVARERRWSIRSRYTEYPLGGRCAVGRHLPRANNDVCFGGSADHHQPIIGEHVRSLVAKGHSGEGQEGLIGRRRAVCVYVNLVTSLAFILGVPLVIARRGSARRRRRYRHVVGW